MSLLLKRGNWGTVRGGAVAVSIVGLVGLLIATTPASGAWFTDAKAGLLTATSGSLNLSLTDGPGNFDYSFDNLMPGQPLAQSLTVKNTGTTAGDLQLQISGSSLTGGNNYDAGLLTMTVSSDKSAPLTLNVYGGTVDLGQLDRGESTIVTITATLDKSAGNEWQGVSVANTITATLTQVRWS